MCLHTLWTKEKTDKWLEDKPENITAYKVIFHYKGNPGRVFPPCYSSFGAYEKINKLGKAKQDDMIETYANKYFNKYKPFFHLFRTKSAADTWADGSLTKDLEAFECKIPKHAITAIGRQDGFVTIVTTEFTFVQGDKYFKEE